MNDNNVNDDEIATTMKGEWELLVKRRLSHFEPEILERFYFKDLFYLGAQCVLALIEEAEGPEAVAAITRELRKHKPAPGPEYVNFDTKH